MAQTRQEIPLQLVRTPQRGGLLVGLLGLVALESETQRVGGVADQGQCVPGQFAQGPTGNEGGAAAGSLERGGYHLARSTGPDRAGAGERGSGRKGGDGVSRVPQARLPVSLVAGIDEGR